MDGFPDLLFRPDDRVVIGGGWLGKCLEIDRWSGQYFWHVEILHPPERVGTVRTIGELALTLDYERPQVVTV